MAKRNFKEHLKNLKSFSIIKVIILYGIIISLLFIKPITSGEAISASDLIYTYDNYSYLALNDFIPSNPLLSDQVNQFEVWKFYSREQIKQGKLPWYNPYQGGGVPLIGNDQSAVFFPTNILFYFLPINLATILGAVVKLVFAALGTFLLLGLIKLNRFVSFIGGLLFALGGFNIVWLGHPHSNVSIFLPWLLYFTYLIYRTSFKKKILPYIGMSLVVFLQFLGGHIETSFHILCASLIFFTCLLCNLLYKMKHKGLKNLFAKFIKYSFKYSIPILVGTMLALIQLIPFFSYLQNSLALEKRSSNSCKTWVQPITISATWLVPNIFGNPKNNNYSQLIPDFSLSKGLFTRNNYTENVTNFNESVQGYAGSIFLLLTPISLLYRKYRKLVMFLIISNIILLASVLGIWPFHTLFCKLPLFNISANHRFLLLSSFITILLGAIGLDYLITYKNKIVKAIPVLTKKIFLLVPFAMILSVIVLMGIKYSNEHINYAMQQITILLTIVSIFLFSYRMFVTDKIISNYLLVIVLLLLLFEIFGYAFNYNPSFNLHKRFPVTSGIQYIQQNQGNATTLFIGNTLPPNIPTVYHIRDLRIYDAMQNAEYAKNFKKAYKPKSSWQIINKLPSLDYVRETNQKYGFNTKFIAIGSSNVLTQKAQQQYSKNIVYSGEDLLIVDITKNTSF